MGGRRGVVWQWKCRCIVSTSVYVLGGVRDGVGGSGFLSMTGVFPGAFLRWGVVW